LSLWYVMAIVKTKCNSCKNSTDYL